MNESIGDGDRVVAAAGPENAPVELAGRRDPQAFVDEGEALAAAGDIVTAADRFRVAIEALDQSTPVHIGRRALTGLACALTRGGAFVNHEGAFADARHRFLRIGREDLEALCLVDSMTVERQRGRVEAALQAGGEAIHLARKLGDVPLEARAHAEVGLTLARAGRYRSAERALLRSMHLYCRAGRLEELHRPRSLLACLGAAQGRTKGARGTVLAALKAKEDVGDGPGAIGVLCNLATLETSTEGNVRSAWNLAARAMRLAEKAHDAHGGVQARTLLAALAATRGHLTWASRLVMSAFGTLTSPDDHLRALVEARFGEILLLGGHLNDARPHFGEAQKLLQRCGHAPGAAMCMVRTAWVAFRAGSLKESHRTAEEARTIHLARGSLIGLPDAALLLIEIYFALGSLSLARQRLLEIRGALAWRGFGTAEAHLNVLFARYHRLRGRIRRAASALQRARAAIPISGEIDIRMEIELEEAALVERTETDAILRRIEARARAARFPWHLVRVLLARGGNAVANGGSWPVRDLQEARAIAMAHGFRLLQAEVEEVLSDAAERGGRAEANRLRQNSKRLRAECLAGLAEDLERVAPPPLQTEALREDLVDVAPSQFPEMVGSSKAIREVLGTLDRFAATQGTVLVEGESGTGKELVAQAIHRLSEAKGEFVALNCAAIPDSLLEAELFGHERGAFTGADRVRVGLIEQAAGGTLFLDEVAEASPRLQAVLLRILEDRRVRRLGTGRDKPVVFRVVAATNRPLRDLVRDRRFREDLFYRLNVHSVRMPPLRERPEDIPALARHFLKESAERVSEPPKQLSPDAVRTLLRYSWPGNVRELENHLARAGAIARGPVINASALDLSEPATTASVAAQVLSLPYGEAKDELMRSYLTELLRRHAGNVSRAAAAIGLFRQSLHRLLKRYGLVEKP